MTTFNSFKNHVVRGKKGLNKGLPMGFPKLETYIYGLQKGRYDVIFGESGTGKSSFVWHAYVMHPYEYLRAHPEINKRLKIKLYSLEVAAHEVIAKMVCWRVYQKLGVLLDVNYILSRGKNTISDEVYKIVLNAQKYFETMLENTLEIYDRPMKPTDIKLDIDAYAKSNGKIIKDKEKKQVKYIPNDPEELVICIFDTVGNLELEPVGGKTSTKLTIDLHSGYCRDYYRNLYNYLAVDISHANRSINDVNRAKTGDLFHQLSDIKETNMLAQNCNLAMCIFDPIRYTVISPNMKTFMGFNVSVLKSRMKVLGILKNRSGENNKRVGLEYLGECGWFAELQKNMGQLEYDRIISQKSLSFIGRAEQGKILAQAIKKQSGNT
jgi:replicative DNA helicase